MTYYTERRPAANLSAENHEGPQPRDATYDRETAGQGSPRCGHTPAGHPPANAGNGSAYHQKNHFLITKIIFFQEVHRRAKTGKNHCGILLQIQQLFSTREF